ncbi:rglC [Symbiodinium natans]|uniref:RglC protein n=1 Tax=Symbiodinium natans TaxID=878477 RepID=A0A812V382_9DINO|nr:rglC [Symbiodinium natans]
MEAGADQFQEETTHLDKGSVDIMVTHGPPAGKLYGKPGKLPSCVSELVTFVQPKLFLCP